MLKTNQSKLKKIIYLSVAVLLSVTAFSTVQIQRSGAEQLGEGGLPIAPAFLDPTFNPVIGGTTSGQVVRTFFQADGKAVIVGAFNVLNGTNANAIARFNTDGTLDTTFNPGAAGPNDSVFTVAQQADGKLLIGGLLTAYNGVPVGRIARLNLDGTIDQSFNSVGVGMNPGAGANNQIGDIKVLVDGKIMIGGIFTSYNGTLINRLARLNADGTLDATFNVGTGPSGEVITITPLADGKIMIGGNFAQYNGTVTGRVSRINTDGSYDTSFSPAGGANQTVRQIIVQPDGKYIITGFLSSFGGFPANGVIRVNPNGSVDQTFSVAGIDAVVIGAALQPDGKVLLGGSFTQIAGGPHQHLARVNADGTNDPTFDAATGIGAQIINDIKLLPDGKFILNGTFSTYRGVPNGGAIRINADGTWDINLANSSALVGNIQSLAVQADNKVIVGGFFGTVGGAVRTNLARVNADGTNDATFNVGGTGPNQTVTASLVQPDGKIIIGGSFTTYNGTAANRILRLNADGTIDSSFTIGTGAAGSVEALLLLADGKILVGGGFATYNGTTVNRFMRLNTDGTLDTTFTTGTALNGTIRQILLQPDNKILIGGSFTTYNGVTRNRMARVNADGTLDTTFDVAAGPNGQVNGFALQPDGSIVMGGPFTSFAGVAKAKLAKVNSAGVLDTTFDIGPGTGFGPGTGPSPTKVLAVEGGRTLVAGNFMNVHGIPHNRIVRVNPNGSIDPTFQVGQGAIAQAGLTIGSMIRQPNGSILIGGQFTIFNTSARTGLARFSNATDTYGDFDGDGKTDFGVIKRPGPSGQWTWWMTNSSNGVTSVMNFGLSPRDMPQPGDFDGDGRDDIAMWRSNPLTGESSAYYIVQSSTNTIKIVPFGQINDVAVTEDYDGDGKDDLSVWRAPDVGSTGQATWFYLASSNNPNNNITYVPFGMRYGATQQDQVDEPYAGDFDGDGKADFRVQRRADTTVSTLSTAAVFYTLSSTTGQVTYDYFGWAGDRILPGDYDGDGKTDIAVARGFNVTPGTTTWYIRYTSGRPDEAIQWGSGGIDIFAQGDYDGDGITDLAIYRRAGEFNFYVRRSSDGAMQVYQMGDSTNCLPIVNYNNR